MLRREKDIEEARIRKEAMLEQQKLLQQQQAQSGQSAKPTGFSSIIRSGLA